MLAVLVTFGAARAQEPPELRWDPIVELRLRLLYEDPDIEDTAIGTSVVGQRARLGLEVRRLGVSARVTFQEARRWTSRDVVTDEGFTPRLAEGWLRIEGDLTRQVGAEVTVGRQALHLHEGRLLGRDDFSLEGQFFDAARFVGHATPVTIELVNARRFSEDEDPLGFGMNLVRLGAGGDNPQTTWIADAVWLVDARDTADTSSTGGVYARFDTGRWRSRAEGYLQSTADGTGSLVGVSAGWVFGPNERLVVSAKYDVLSGDGSATEGGPAAWRPVLGEHRRFNGLMDRFATPEDHGGRGLSDLQLVVESRPAPPLLATLAAHRFWSPLDGGAYGTELDALAEWWFSPFAAARAGGAWFGPDPGFDAPQRLFGYVELDADF